jgi:ferredoxin-NADP reductase
MAATAIRRRLSWQQAEVLALERESDRCVRISLRPPAWPGHRPGQHLDVRLTAPDGYTAQRSYSIASPPQQHVVELVVERLVDGEVSPYLTDVLEVGDELELRGPVGGYFVWPTDPGGPIQLVAGGSGVVPMLAMLGHHRLTGSSVALRLLYSLRGEGELVGSAELAHQRPTLEVVLTYTRSAPAGWTGATGRVDRELLDRYVLPPDQRPLVLVCGPTAFVEVVAQALIEIGHDPGRIKTERFGGMGDQQ